MRKIVYKLLIIFTIIILSINVIIYYDKLQSNIKKVTSYIKISSTHNYYYKPLIIIPKIKLKQIVVKANKSFSNMDNNLVYYNIFSPNNRIIIFGHSGTSYGTYFNRIHELKYGDDAYVYFQDRCYKYQVYSVDYIGEDNVEILKNASGNNELYLVTCIKNDKSKRLLVKLRQQTVSKAPKIGKK